MLASAFPIFTPVDSGRLAKEISLAKLNEGAGLVDSFSFKFNVQNYKGGGIPITTQSVIEAYGEADLPNAGASLRFEFDGNPSLSIKDNARLDLRNDTAPGYIFLGTTSETSQTIGYASTNGGEITLRGGNAILGIHSETTEIDLSIDAIPTLSLGALGLIDLRHPTVGQGTIKFGADSGLDNLIKYDGGVNFIDEAIAILGGGATTGIGFGKGYVMGSESDTDLGGDIISGSTLYFDHLFPSWTDIGVLTLGGATITGENVIVRPAPSFKKTAGNLLNIGNDDGSGNFSSRAFFDFEGNLSILGPSASSGTHIKLRRADGTIVTLTVDNLNTLVIS